MNKKQIIWLAGLLLCPLFAMGEELKVASPDGRLGVTVVVEQGKVTYSVAYDGKEMVKKSALGLNTNLGDFSKDLTFVSSKNEHIDKTYDMTRTKTSKVHYVANQLNVDLKTAAKLPMRITFNVSNNDVAFRYELGRGEHNNPKCAIIKSEASSFCFPSVTTTFICPQITPMTGWERTKPSYEEEYKADATMSEASQYGVGYTFPCLFRVGDDGWVLVSETGVTSGYCGSRLSDWKADTGYTIAYPQPGENNGIGTEYAAVPLPCQTPWRTLTIGKTLAPIVETTVQFDVLDPLYTPSIDYKAGRYTWSWLIWQDNSVCYEDQVAFIDLAAEMGYEYTLVDGLWDKQIGYEKVEELSKYAQSKGVHLLLWYNSNGYENDAPQGPRNVMNNSIQRKKDMQWMKKIGVKGIKVDFFGGDKQETMKLYEDILSDANDYGLQVIFHGCTLPRGWERLYPNYVGSEGALASENVYFTDHHARMEGFEMTMHPFSRNTVGSFDWGGVMMNKYMSRDNKSRHQRYTGDIFEMATAITNQASVNCVAMCPNNLEELPQFELDFLRTIPTTWDETKFIDGYPTRYAVIARRTGNSWYVGGLNGTDQPITLTLQLPMFAGKTVTLYTDLAKKKGQTHAGATKKELKVNKKGEAKITLQPMGGVILR